VVIKSIDYRRYSFTCDILDGVMVDMLTSSAVDHVLVDPWSGQTKDYKIGICCFSAKHAELRSTKKM